LGKAYVEQINDLIILIYFWRKFSFDPSIYSLVKLNFTQQKFRTFSTHFCHCLALSVFFRFVTLCIQLNKEKAKLCDNKPTTKIHQIQ